MTGYHRGFAWVLTDETGCAASTAITLPPKIVQQCCCQASQVRYNPPNNVSRVHVSSIGLVPKPHSDALPVRHLSIVPGSSWSMAPVGSRRIEIAGMGYKR